MNNVILDGVEISQEQLQEKMMDTSKRIVKVSEGVYKTLNRIQG